MFNIDYEAKLYLYRRYRTPGIQAQLNCLKNYKKRIRIPVIYRQYIVFSNIMTRLLRVSPKKILNAATLSKNVYAFTWKSFLRIVSVILTVINSTLTIKTRYLFELHKQIQLLFWDNCCSYLLYVFTKVFDFQSQGRWFFTFFMGFWGIANERKAHCQLITKSDNLKKFIV